MRYRITDRRTSWETQSIQTWRHLWSMWKMFLNIYVTSASIVMRNIVTQTFVSMWYVWTIKKPSILLIANNSRSIWNKLYKCDHCGYEATSRSLLPHTTRPSIKRQNKVNFVTNILIYITRNITWRHLLTCVLQYQDLQIWM